MEDIVKTAIFLKTLFRRIMLNYCIYNDFSNNYGYIPLWYMAHNSSLWLQYDYIKIIYY